MALVLWSGGCDSTLVLYDLAREASAEKPVRALSIEHDGVGAEKEQRRARARVLSRMKRDGLPVKHTTVKITLNGPFFTIPSGTSQPLIWLPSAILFLDEKEDLYTGYIREDDIWHYRSQLYNLFGVMQAFRGHSGDLILPLEWEPKRSVIARLKNTKLADLVWWCEEPKAGKPCGRCHECERHDSALRDLTLQEARKPLGRFVVKHIKPKARKKKRRKR